MILDYALGFAFVCFGLGLLICLWRVVFAPSIPDRVLALDTMVVNMIALLVLYGMYYGTGIYFEAAMLFAMTGFVGTVAFCKFLLRGSVIE